MREKHKTLFVISGLTIAVLAAFWQVDGFDFVSYDDYGYVSRNEHISTGLTLENVAWVFTHAHGGNWHPLTGLSHILDCQLFGLNPGWHHLVNLIFHIANTLLLFVILKQMTGLPRRSEAATDAFWRSAFVAAVFGLHPAHVESVAWISERKDVLSTLFFLLTIASYVRYVKLRGKSRYLLTLLLFTLGLMAKPMLVTLPFVLLLLDYWPLNRVEITLTGKIRWQSFYPLIREKIPLFILSAVSSAVTIFVQKNTGALAGAELIPLKNRIANAIISYGAYIGELFWPAKLAVFYPYPRAIQPWWQILTIAVLFLIITIVVIRLGRKYKYLPTGWFWYMGTLFPVIGIVQVGMQSMADRYTYIPFIGLFIISAWGANDLLAKSKYSKVVLWSLSFSVIIVLAVLTWFQAGFWRDSISLFDHALSVTENNFVAYNSRGFAYYEKGRFDGAISDYKKAVEINPRYTNAYNNLGLAYYKIGRYDLAIGQYNKALEINPKFFEAANNRGLAWYEKSDFDRAIADYTKTLAINPAYDIAYYNRGNAYAHGKSLYDLAIADYDKAIELNPRYALAYYNRGSVCCLEGRYDLGILDYDKAIELNPMYPDAYLNKAAACESLGRKSEAIEAYKIFIQYAPANRSAQIEHAKQKIKELEQKLKQ
jgi:tetratricopeptide (TPR) repeat protein